MAEAQAAFHALFDLAQRSRDSAQALPSQVQAQAQWSGIGFTLLGRQFVAPIGEVSELLEVPSYTHLPGVKPWVLGVANVRGRLLPLINLAGFFGGRLEAQRKHHRVLVLEAGDLYAGLVVDRSLGMQHFLVDGFRSQPDEVSEDLAPFLAGAYSQSLNDDEGRHDWLVFSPAKLSEDPRFANAAD